MLIRMNHSGTVTHDDNSELQMIEPAGVVVRQTSWFAPYLGRTSEAMFSPHVCSKPRRSHRCARAASKIWGKPRGLPYHDAFSELLMVQ